MPPTKRNYGPCIVCIQELTNGEATPEISTTARWIQVKEEEVDGFLRHWNLPSTPFPSTRVEACGKHMKQWNESKRKIGEAMDTDIISEMSICPAKPQGEPCKSDKIPSRKANARNESFLGVPADTKICTDCYFRFITFKRKKEAQEKREKAKKQKVPKLERGLSNTSGTLDELLSVASVAARTRSKASPKNEVASHGQTSFQSFGEFGLLPFLIAVTQDDYDKVFV